MPRKLSESMRKTLEALNEREDMIYAGTTSGEVMASGGSRSALYLAVKKGWARPYGHDYSFAAHGEGKAPKYYRTSEGTAALNEGPEGLRELLSF